MLEIYQNSFGNDPCTAFESTTPFMNFSKGDLVDPGMWENCVEAPPRTWFQIKDIIHRDHQINKSYIRHQIGLCMVAIDKSKLT